MIYGNQDPSGMPQRCKNECGSARRPAARIYLRTGAASSHSHREGRDGVGGLRWGRWGRNLPQWLPWGEGALSGRSRGQTVGNNPPKAGDAPGDHNSPSIDPKMK